MWDLSKSPSPWRLITYPCTRNYISTQISSTYLTNVFSVFIYLLLSWSNHFPWLLTLILLVRHFVTIREDWRNESHLIGLNFLMWSDAISFVCAYVERSDENGIILLYKHPDSGPTVAYCFWNFTLGYKVAEQILEKSQKNENNIVTQPKLHNLKMRSKITKIISFNSQMSGKSSGLACDMNWWASNVTYIRRSEIPENIFKNRILDRCRVPAPKKSGSNHPAGKYQNVHHFIFNWPVPRLL